jgi:hypothetical protein
LLLRIPVIILAALCASVGAAAVITAAAILPAWSALMLDVLDQGAIGAPFGFLALFFSFAALLPALVVIVLAETLAIRSVLFYAFAGGAVSCLLYVRTNDWNTLAFSVDGFARREIEIMAAAGIVAGFIYWAVAGRNAGRRTGPARTPAAAPPGRTPLDPQRGQP